MNGITPYICMYLLADFSHAAEMGNLYSNIPGSGDERREYRNVFIESMKPAGPFTFFVKKSLRELAEQK